MARILATLAACAALVAIAESNTMTGKPGFFKPTPDGNSSISRVVPPPQPPLVIADVAITNTPPEPAIPTTEPNPLERVRKSEVEMDRANREHREMSRRSALATQIAPGAYNGATNERDR